MRIVVDSEKINTLTYELLRNKYNLFIDDAADIAEDIEELIKNNEDD